LHDLEKGREARRTKQKNIKNVLLKIHCFFISQKKENFVKKAFELKAQQTKQIKTKKT